MDLAAADLSGVEIHVQRQHEIRLRLQVKGVLGGGGVGDVEGCKGGKGNKNNSLSAATWTVLEQIFLVLKYMYKDNMEHAEDYRLLFKSLGGRL